MELFQTTQWLFGDVSNKYNTTGPDSCSQMNKYFTYVAFVLIWLQPFLFSLIGYIEMNQRNIFWKFMILNILVFTYSFFNLYYATEINEKVTYAIQDNMIATSTCTDTGPNHHLSWRFKTINVDLQPNNFAYLMLCMTTFLFYSDKLLNIPLGWVTSLLFTKLIFNVSNTEIASSWCLLSVIANLIIFVRS